LPEALGIGDGNVRALCNVSCLIRDGGDRSTDVFDVEDVGEVSLIPESETRAELEVFADGDREDLGAGAVEEADAAVAEATDVALGDGEGCRIEEVAGANVCVGVDARDAVGTLIAAVGALAGIGAGGIGGCRHARGKEGAGLQDGDAGKTPAADEKVDECAGVPHKLLAFAEGELIKQCVHEAITASVDDVAVIGVVVVEIETVGTVVTLATLTDERGGSGSECVGAVVREGIGGVEGEASVKSASDLSGQGFVLGAGAVVAGEDLLEVGVLEQGVTQRGGGIDVLIAAVGAGDGGLELIEVGAPDELGGVGAGVLEAEDGIGVESLLDGGVPLNDAWVFEVFVVGAAISGAGCCACDGAGGKSGGAVAVDGIGSSAAEDGVDV
jgi:hypothetical protein